jgi:hypothetical protein
MGTNRRPSLPRRPGRRTRRRQQLRQRLRRRPRQHPNQPRHLFRQRQRRRRGSRRPGQCRELSRPRAAAAPSTSNSAANRSRRSSRRNSSSCLNTVGTSVARFESSIASRTVTGLSTTARARARAAYGSIYRASTTATGRPRRRSPGRSIPAEAGNRGPSAVVSLDRRAIMGSTSGQWL